MIMKQWKFLSLALLIMAGVSFSACQKDEEEDLGPTISLKMGEGYTYEDFEVTEGTTLTFGITASKSTTSDNNLNRFNIFYASGSQELTLVDSVFNNAAFNSDYSIEFLGTGSATIKFRVTSEGGLTDEKELNVVVTAAGVAVKKISDIELGSWNDPIGSFYNIVDEMAYTVSAAKQNQEKVDFLFFLGAVNQNTIAAPDDEDANTIATFELGDWTTKNATRFNASDMTAEEFDAITDLHVFPEFDVAGATSKANQLATGQVVMFRTVAGKLGYIKINDLYRSGDKILLDVIVEE
jgi:hypothetical protein